MTDQYLMELFLLDPQSIAHKLLPLQGLKEFPSCGTSPTSFPV